MDFYIIILPLCILIILFFIVRPKSVQIPLRSSHVLISGGSSGIGLSLARICAAEGADVTILARSASKLEEAQRSIKEATGRDVRTVSADVRDYDAVRHAVAEAAAPIDVLVCSHGVFWPQELEEQEAEEVRFMVDVNLMGTFHLIKAALPGMRSNREGRGPGAIAIMSSQAGQVGIYGYTAYSASKFGLKGLAEALQQEVITSNIHVSLIFPPDTETPAFVEAIPTMTRKKRRPQPTSVIAFSPDPMKPDEVARKSPEGIQRGSFLVSCNRKGLLLLIATAVYRLERSYPIAFLEVMLGGPARFIALLYQWNWYVIIEKWHATGPSAS